MIRESKIEAWLSAEVKKLGGKSYKFVSPGNPGMPDRIYVLPGGTVHFAELKRDAGQLSKIQAWQLDVLKKMGCNVRTIYGMEQAREFIEELREVTPWSSSHMDIRNMQ